MFQQSNRAVVLRDMQSTLAGNSIPNPIMARHFRLIQSAGRADMFDDLLIEGNVTEPDKADAPVWAQYVLGPDVGEPELDGYPYFVQNPELNGEDVEMHRTIAQVHTERIASIVTVTPFEMAWQSMKDAVIARNGHFTQKQLLTGLERRLRYVNNDPTYYTTLLVPTLLIDHSVSLVKEFDIIENETPVDERAIAQSVAFSIYRTLQPELVAAPNDTRFQIPLTN